MTTVITSPSMAKEKKPVDPNRKICRQSDVTGSIMAGKSICHTAAEWTQIDTQNSANVQARRDHGGAGMSAGTVGGTP